ncbi:hypothetical protein [Mesorhizobium sp. SP-1A]|uniref:hypothetical protein n=1 Tax=Mesorhizobium sp. SP-1A TaxID=3077840 RepID=UPI0028F6CA0F|nr:hypothetical protein [Mesorhizobium sp. SP-1A]
MFKTIRTAALSALVGLGALAAIPAVAQADGIYLNYGTRPDTRLGVYVGDRDARDWGRDRDARGWGRDRDRYGDRDWRRSCSPDRALDKAERMGLRRARVVDMSRHTIRVAGFKYNSRVTVVFGRDRGCPIAYR